MRLAHLELLVLSYLIAADRRISLELRTASDNTLQQQNQGGRTPRPHEPEKHRRTSM
jgi:hypothetical protein